MASRFSGVPRPSFSGRGADAETPRALVVALTKRRPAAIAEAKGVLAHLPGPGESLHALCTARMDLTDVITVLLERYGACDRMCVATLAFNARNLSSMIAWLDGKAVAGLTLLSSIFLRSHKGQLWANALQQFRDRKQRVACCHSHAKVVTMEFRSGERLSIEGSANLCGNGSGREQFCLINDQAITDWHATWINEMVERHEGEEKEVQPG